MKQLTMTELRAMSDDELKTLSTQKNRRGRYTTNANNAMKVRRERSGHWEGVSSRAPGFVAQEIEYRGTSHFTKKFK